MVENRLSHVARATGQGRQGQRAAVVLVNSCAPSNRLAKATMLIVPLLLIACSGKDPARSAGSDVPLPPAASDAAASTAIDFASFDGLRNAEGKKASGATAGKRARLRIKGSGLEANAFDAEPCEGPPDAIRLAFEARDRDLVRGLFARGGCATVQVTLTSCESRGMSFCTFVGKLTTIAGVEAASSAASPAGVDFASRYDFDLAGESAVGKTARFAASAMIFDAVAVLSACEPGREVPVGRGLRIAVKPEQRAQLSTIPKSDWGNQRACRFVTVKLTKLGVVDAKSPWSLVWSADLVDVGDAVGAEVAANGSAEPASGVVAPSGFWDRKDLVKVEDGEDCPEGFWALFGGEAPGHDEFATHENESKRKALATAARGRTYVAIVEKDADLKDYDFGRHLFPVEVFGAEGTFGCDAPNDGPTKNITIAFRPAHPVDPQAGHDSLVGFYQWQASPLRLEIAVPDGEAKKFKEAHDGDVRALVAFTIANTQEDHRKVRATDTPSGFDDHGAGRLVTAKVLALKVFDRDDGAVLIDTAPK